MWMPAYSHRLVMNGNRPPWKKHPDLSPSPSCPAFFLIASHSISPDVPCQEERGEQLRRQIFKYLSQQIQSCDIDLKSRKVV